MPALELSMRNKSRTRLEASLPRSRTVQPLGAVLFERRLAFLGLGESLADAVALAGVLEFDGHARGGFGLPRDRGKNRAFLAVVEMIEQAAADRLHQAGLAGAVGPVQHDDAGAQVGERQRFDASPVVDFDGVQPHRRTSWTNRYRSSSACRESSLVSVSGLADSTFKRSQTARTTPSPASACNSASLGSA